MSWGAAAWLMLGGSTVLLFIGLPVAFSFLVINLVGAWIWLGGEPGLMQLTRNSVNSVMSFALTPIPLFVLMGEVLFHTGLAVKVIDGIERLIRQVPGRLAVVAVVAGTVFSAISGSTIATTAMLGSLMVPVMLARADHSFRNDIDHLARPISRQILEQVWITTSGIFSEPPFLAALLTFGIDRIMFSVDYPYATHAQGKAFLDRISIPPADMEKLCWRNAAALLKLGG